MIGRETLWDSLLLTDTLPSLTSDFYNLFLLSKHSRAHVSSFNSKLFLSSLLQDTTLSRPLTGVIANMWLRAHGFSSPISISLEGYLTTVKDFELQMYFTTELRSLPDLLYNEVLERVIDVICADRAFLNLLPCVLEIEVLKCKVGVSQGAILGPCLEHITQHLHLLSLETVDKLTLLTCDITFLVCYTGTATLITATSGICDVREHLFFSPDSQPPNQNRLFSSRDTIPLQDEVLCELHEQNKSTCCQFQTSCNTNSQFQHLYPAYEACVMFLDTLAVHATSQNQPTVLVNMYALGKYLLSDQLARALYSPSHVRFIEELVDSVPEEFSRKLRAYPIYKTYNFDPELAEWGELVLQVRSNLSKSSKSFEVMMKTSVLDKDKIADCIGLVNLLKPAQLAAFFSRAFSNYPSVSSQSQINVIERFMLLFSNSPPKFVSSFCKALYNELGFSQLELSQLKDESKEGLLGENKNVTKTINQLGSKGTGKWRDKLYHTLLLNFILFPELLLRNVVSQATRNKALVSPVSVFLKEFLPFTLKPSCTLSEIVCTSLKKEFTFMKTIKEIKQFDMFIDSLKPILTHEAILKHILLPYMKCSQCHLNSTLTLLQFYMQRTPFYNFSVSYEIVRIWSTPDLDESCLKLLDDGGILNNMIDKMKAYPKEAELLFKLITRGWGWRTGLRFLSITDEAKINFPRFWSGVDISSYIAHDSLVFLKSDVTFNEDNINRSVAHAVLQIAKLSEHTEFHLAVLGRAQFTGDLFEEFGKLRIRSDREWDNVSRFLMSCFENDVINLEEAITIEPNLTVACEIVLETLQNIDIDDSLYLCNDLSTFILLSAVAGNFDVLNWFGKICDRATSKNVTSQPTDVTSQHTDVTSQPIDVTSQPTDATSQPTDATSQHTDVTPQPTDATSQPTDVMPQHTDVTSQPTAATTQPTGVTLQPTDVTSLELTKHFVRSCVLFYYIKTSQSLETLIMSLSSAVDMKQSDVGKVLVLLPEQLRNTLSYKSSLVGCDTSITET